MQVSGLRSALQTALSTIPDVQVNAYALSQPTPPGLQILPPGVVYDKAMHRGLDEWTVMVQGFVSFSTDVGSQVLLDQLCASTGSNSVKAALEADRTLGGVVETLHVLEQSPGSVVSLPNTSGQMLLVEWKVQVLARGSS